MARAETFPLPAKLLALAFAGSGVVHLVKPEVYEPLIPDWMPGPREIVLVSGVAELVCAAGLAHPRTRLPLQIPMIWAALKAARAEYPSR